jgi:hypothetical protein
VQVSPHETWSTWPNYFSRVAFQLQCAACFIEWCMFSFRRVDAWRYSDVSERELGSVIMNGVLGREYCLTLRWGIGFFSCWTYKHWLCDRRWIALWVHYVLYFCGSEFLFSEGGHKRRPHGEFHYFVNSGNAWECSVHNPSPVQGLFVEMFFLFLMAGALIDCLWPMRPIKVKKLLLMEAIPLCDSVEVYINLRLDTTNYTVVSNYELISVWRHVSAAHATILRPA